MLTSISGIIRFSIGVAESIECRADNNGLTVIDEQFGHAAGVGFTEIEHPSSAGDAICVTQPRSTIVDLGGIVASTHYGSRGTGPGLYIRHGLAMSVRSPPPHPRRRQLPDSDSALMLVCARIRYVTANTWSDRRYIRYMDMSRFNDNLQSAA